MLDSTQSSQVGYYVAVSISLACVIVGCLIGLSAFLLCLDGWLKGRGKQGWLPDNPYRIN